MAPRVNHLNYYDYQVKARGILNGDDVRRDAANKAFVYDRLILPHLPVDRSAPIVELACGHGAFLVWAASHGYTSLVGVDSSPAQIEAVGLVGINAVLGDVLAWMASRPPRSAAVLVAIDLIEHVSKDDFMTLLAESSRILMPGGSLILRYPNGDSPFVGLNLFNDVTHIWTYTSNCLRTLSGMHGFARADFCDEGWRVARDHRWLKIPLGSLGEMLLRTLVRSVTREHVPSWNSNGWARLQVPPIGARRQAESARGRRATIP